MNTAIYFILMLSAIILIHELGHFLMARLFNVYVYEFALGMGPRVLQWKGKETIYSLRLLPIGGMVAMAGDEQKEDDFEIPSNRLLGAIAGWKKIFIFLAGPLMNFILAWVIFVGIYANLGYVFDPPPAVINGVIEDSPAEKAGFEFGDQILKISFADGTSIEPKDFYEIIQYTQLHTDETVYTIKRNEEELEITVLPAYNAAEDRYLVGMLLPESNKRAINFVGAIQEGSKDFIASTTAMVKVLQTMLKGIGLNNLSGPVGIYTMTEQQISYGIISFLSLVALLSVNVGFMNLLPVPMFDGGRVLIVLIESIIGKKLPEKLEIGLMYGSLALIVGLFIFVTFNDVSRLLG